VSSGMNSLRCQCKIVEKNKFLVLGWMNGWMDGWMEDQPS